MRLIENYNINDITIDFINSQDWDLIKLHKTIDVEKLQEWYNTISKNLSHLKFNFATCSKYVKDTINDKFTTDTNNYKWSYEKVSIELQNSYTLTWWTEKDIPIPPPWASNLKYFPELEKYYDNEGNLKVDFDYSENIYLQQYMFGAWKDLSNCLKSYIFNPRISEHLPGHIIPLHTDGYIARLHIPITSDNSKFYWGDQYNREYKLERGCIYMINPKISHGTTNWGPTTRANILCDLYPDKIIDILKL